MKLFEILILLFLFVANLFAQCPQSISAHSHNDYENPKPLFLALKHCCKSIEADIHLVKGKLLVAHDLEEVDEQRSLENLYLIPLSEIFEKKHRDLNFHYELFLLIDIKSKPENTFPVLLSVLKKYEQYLTYFQNGELNIRNIRIILSGNRPVEQITELEKRIVFLDGRISDAENDLPNELYPMISDSKRSFMDYFQFDGIGFVESSKFKEFLKRVHNQGKLLRIWGMPDNSYSWKIQLDNGIDLINTDEVENYHSFYISYNVKE